MATTSVSAWQRPSQAFMSVRYWREPYDSFDITDVRQPYPMEVALWVRKDGEIQARHRWPLIPLMPNTGMKNVTSLDHPPEPDGDARDWEEVAPEIEAVLAEVDMVITYGEGRLIDAYRQLNALSVRQATLHDRRVCVDGLARLAGVDGLDKDQWGYFSPIEAAVEARVHASTACDGALESALDATLRLFDWSHEKMHGMNFEAALPGADAEKLHDYPTCLPQKKNFILESYQEEAIQKSLSHAEYGRGGLSIMPTGSGKTILSAVRNASILKANPGMRVMVLAENPKILRQMVKTYRDLYPEFTVTECFSGKKDLSGQVVVASRQQLSYIYDSLAEQRFGIVDIDESHHAASSQYKEVLGILKKANAAIMVFGETATPRRPDGKSLRPIFGQVTSLVRLQEVRKTGRIVDLDVIRDDQMSDSDIKKVQSLSSQKSFANIGSIDKEISEVINTEENNKRIVRLYKRHAKKRLTVVYALNIRHAEDIRDEFLEAGVECELIHSRDGRSEAGRADVLERFEKKAFRVLINVMSLTEGWDCPPASCAIIARPANHPSILEQIVGRILRSCKGKRNALLIEVGVNKDALNQFMFQFFDHALGMNGVRLRKGKKPKGAVPPVLLPEEAVAEAESGSSSGDADWVPPMLALGKGWLGFRLDGRLMACRASEGEWLALEMRDPTTMSRPDALDVPDLKNVFSKVNEAWKRYRHSGDFTSPPTAGKAAVSPMLRRWQYQARQRAGLIDRRAARHAMRLALSEMRWHAVYRHLYAIEYTRHESVSDFYEWVKSRWLPALDGTLGKDDIVQELRSAPETADYPVAHRYHERLLAGASAWRPQMARIERDWLQGGLGQASMRAVCDGDVSESDEGVVPRRRPLPATSFEVAYERIMSAAVIGSRTFDKE